MLIHDRLPNNYIDSINYVYNHYKNKNLNGNNSVHYWIDDIEEFTLKYHLNRLRNAPEIFETISEHYPNSYIRSSHNSDEIYLSVSPDKRSGSDIALSNCHYDAPWKYIYQGKCNFLRVILSLNENTTVYTQVEDNISILSTADYNIIDYNQDYHCVHGEIPKGKERIMLKLHYVVCPKDSHTKWADFTMSINNWWTHFSREIMRDSINPNNISETIKKNVVLTSRFIWNYKNYFSSILLLYISVIYVLSNKKRLRKYLTR